MSKKRLIAISVLFFLLFLPGCGKIKQKISHVKQKTKAAVKLLLSFDETTEKCPSNLTFDNYPGFRDWYRIPLKYPYHLIIVDSFEKGTLHHYHGGDIRNPMVSSRFITGDIMAILPHETFLLFQKKSSGSIQKTQYGIFFYKTKELKIFDPESELNSLLPDTNFKKFITLEEAYQKFTRRISGNNEMEL